MKIAGVTAAVCAVSGRLPRNGLVRLWADSLSGFSNRRPRRKASLRLLRRRQLLPANRAARRPRLHRPAGTPRTPRQSQRQVRRAHAGACATTTSKRDFQVGQDARPRSGPRRRSRRQVPDGKQARPRSGQFARVAAAALSRRPGHAARRFRTPLHRQRRHAFHRFSLRETILPASSSISPRRSIPASRPSRGRCA